MPRKPRGRPQNGPEGRRRGRRLSPRRPRPRRLRPSRGPTPTVPAPQPIENPPDGGMGPGRHRAGAAGRRGAHTRPRASGAPVTLDPPRRASLETHDRKVGTFNDPTGLTPSPRGWGGRPSCRKLESRPTISLPQDRNGPQPLPLHRTRTARYEHPPRIPARGDTRPPRSVDEDEYARLLDRLDHVLELRCGVVRHGRREGIPESGDRL